MAHKIGLCFNSISSAIWNYTRWVDKIVLFTILYKQHIIIKWFKQLSYEKELLNGSPATKYAASFQQLTKMLCDLITMDGFQHNYLHRLLKTWLCCLQRIPNRVAKQIDCNLMWVFQNPSFMKNIAIMAHHWFDSHRPHRQSCGKFLIGAKNYSIQMRMLNIIVTYLHRKHERHPAKKAHTFFVIFGNTINVTSDVIKKVTDAFIMTTALRFEEKHRLLDLLNTHSSIKRSVYSIPIKSMKLAGIPVRKVWVIFCLFRYFVSNAQWNGSVYRMIQDGCTSTRWTVRLRFGCRPTINPKRWT